MRLPPLNALRAFEAAARHGSFVKAADELYVTQGAVSRHVKLLEEHLGVVLFQRQPNGVALTPRGQLLAPELSAAFERIVQVAARVAEDDRELRITAPPTLSARWLMRRLAGFRDLRPDLRVTVGILTDCADVLKGGFDLAIVDPTIARDHADTLDTVLLRHEAMAPVCAPGLLDADAAQPLRVPADLARHVLLHPDLHRRDWLVWLRAAGLPAAWGEQGGHTFQTLEMATAAAIGGLGVAIVDLHLIRAELASGVLVAPFELVLSEGTGYYVAAARGRLAEPKLAAFVDWLLAEMAATG